MEAALQPHATTKLDLDNHPTRLQAQLAYLKGIEALSGHPEARPAHIHWLQRQKPVAMTDDGWILVAYPNETEARLAYANEAMVRLGHRLRAIEAAQGVQALAVGAQDGPAPCKGSSDSKRRPRRDERQPWERRPVYMPAFLVATTLPHSDPKASEFTRINGKLTTTLHAPRRPGLPFGVYPRLILIQIATSAVLTKSREFQAGRSINELLSRMGLSHSGGTGGGGQSTLARDQLNRICATTFTTTHLSPYGGSNLTVADHWLEKTEDGLMIELSERFFEQATKSAVALDPFILRQLRRSPLSIDIYGWLTYRMSRLEEPTTISWPSIERQFGSEYKHPRQFRWMFRKCLGRIKDAWPGELDVEVQDTRVALHPGPPSVASRRERSNAKGG